jgi:hypothetical protein
MRDGPMADMAMASMSGAMPCCPHEKPGLPDCSKTCPYAILCMAGCLSIVPAETDFVVLRSKKGSSLALINDAERDLLGEPPPPRPPRI